MNATAMKDQMQAALRDADRVRRVLAEHMGTEGREVQMPPWVCRQFETLVEMSANGKARVCPHLTSPQPAFAAAWRPGVLVCGRCVDSIAARGIENYTCDRCGRYASPISANLAARGLVSFQFGLCRSCDAKLGLRESEPS
jgi:hypothetical protein